MGEKATVSTTKRIAYPICGHHGYKPLLLHCSFVVRCALHVAAYKSLTAPLAHRCCMFALLCRRYVWKVMPGKNAIKCRFGYVPPNSWHRVRRVDHERINFCVLLYRWCLVGARYIGGFLILIPESTVCCLISTQMVLSSLLKRQTPPLMPTLLQDFRTPRVTFLSTYFTLCCLSYTTESV